MHRIPVPSKEITQVGYQEHSETLEIKFEHGGVYQFFNVPADVMRPPKRGIITRKSASASPTLAFGDSDLVLLEDFRERSRGRSFPGIRGWLN